MFLVFETNLHIRAPPSDFSIPKIYISAASFTKWEPGIQNTTLDELLVDEQQQGFAYTAAVAGAHVM